MRDQIEWKVVEILDIRKTKLFLELANSDDDDDDYVEKYDTLPISQHPKLEAKEMYWQQYLREFKKDQDEKAKTEQLMKDLSLEDQDKEMEN